jgi:GntR family transcriptional regulator, galactonate operon transcriptional repressor
MSLRPPQPGYPPGGLHGQLVHAIGRQIASGAIQPGDVLPMPAGLTASRTVLREAIKVLAAKGLVESRPKTGTRVRPRRTWNLLDPDVLVWQQEGTPAASFLRSLTEVRQIVEPSAAALAAARANARERAAIAEAYRDMERALAGRNGNQEAFVRADIRFHRAILEACENDLLEQMSRVVYSALTLSFRATSRLPGSAKASLPRHRAILTAIAGRDPRRARRAMERLVESTAREVEALRKRRRG